MTNAEVTAENRPACRPNQYTHSKGRKKTHKYQRGIEDLVVPLDELSVVLFRFMAVRLVELGPVTLLDRWKILFLTAQGFNV